MTKKKRIVIVILALMFLFFIINLINLTGLDNPALFPVSRVVREIFAPLQEGITSLSEGTGDFFAYFQNNKVLRQENEMMAVKIAELQEEIYGLKEYEQENERLRKLLDYKEERKENYKLILCGVIGRDPGNWFRTLIVNKGSEHGIRKDMAVVNHDGLVGIVIGVTKNTSEILMLLDSDSAVGGRIFETRVTPGVVVGTGRPDYLEMIHLPHDVEIEVGQTVVTSGLGGIFSKGIRIGEVSEIKTEPNGLMKKALIRPFVDFDRLEEVFILVEVMTPENDQLETVSQENG